MPGPLSVDPVTGELLPWEPPREDPLLLRVPAGVLAFLLDLLLEPLLRGAA